MAAGALSSDARPSPAADGPPPTSYSSASSCYDGTPNDHGGWIHVVANGETWAVTLNATVVHPPDARVSVNVSERPTGGYEVALSTIPDDRTDSTRDCERATDVNVGTSLREPAFVVTLDGRIVRSVEQDETVANLYPIPNPLDATE